MTDNELIQKAKEFATYAHKDHFRNDKDKTPYIHHLAEVAQLVEDSGDSAVEIAAAWLHDSVEDTITTIEDIEREFGQEIKTIVERLTDLPEWTEMPVNERKAKQADRIKHEGPSIKRIKLADQTSNIGIVGKGTTLFDPSTNHLYIDSAKMVADVCKGISDYLDKELEKRYVWAKKNLSI